MKILLKLTVVSGLLFMIPSLLPAFPDGNPAPYDSPGHVLSVKDKNDSNLRMHILDKETSEGLPYVSVSLKKEGDKSASIFGLTSSDGNIYFRNVPDGRYILTVQIMGYKSHEQKIELKGKADLGDIRLEVDAEALDAASISAVGNPVIVKKDTIEYTASSFKTSDNDMLEQLLKKLPGVEVSPDGSITANGEPVKKITIGGKTFFLDDPKLASRNIPAKMVEKVKVVEKKSDQAIFTGIDDGERETVIDLKFRPGMAEGWMGNFVASGGHDLSPEGTYSDKNAALKEGWRWNGSAMTGRFDEKSQISVLLNGNNINSSGFNDMSGAMMQNMRGTIKGMGSGHAGWGGGNGITTSWMGGVNGVFSLCEGDMDLGASYLYSGSDKNVQERSDKITYMENGSELYNHNEGASNTLSQGHRFGIRLEHKFSENTSILFEPQVDFGGGHFSEYSVFNSSRSSGDEVMDLNKGFMETSGRNKNWNAKGRLLFRQRLGKPGRTLSVFFRYDFSGNNLRGFNQSLTSLNTQADPLLDPVWSEEDAVNQRYDSAEDKIALRGKASYTEPLGRNFYFEANYSYSWSRNKSFKDTFNSGSAGKADGGHMSYDPSGEMKDDIYSNNVLQRYINHQAGVNFSYQKDKLYAQIGASVNPTDNHYVTNGKIYDSQVINWSPRISLSYEFNPANAFRIYYYGYSSQPSASQIMPVPDNSDPLNMHFGNPYLEPSFGHYIRGKYSYTNRRTFTSVHARMGASLVQDPISSASWYDEGGVRYSLPVNGRNRGDFYIGGMVTSPFGKSGFSISSWTSLSYNNSSSYLGNEEMGKKTADYFVDDQGEPSEQFNYEKFHRENPDIDQSGLFSLNRTDGLNFVERLRFTYRNDFVELNLGGRTMMSKSWYTLNQKQKPRWNNQVDFSMNWTIPAGFGLVSDLQYNWYNGYVNAQKPEFVLNAEISKLFFKDRMTLSVKAYDIFAQSKNLHVSDASNYHQEVWNNTLGRYIMVSLSFRFGKGNSSQDRGRRFHPHMVR